MCFHLNNQQFKIFFEDNILAPIKTPKYSGVTLDRTLGYKELANAAVLAGVILYSVILAGLPLSSVALHWVLRILRQNIAPQFATDHEGGYSTKPDNEDHFRKDQIMPPPYLHREQAKTENRQLPIQFLDFTQQDQDQSLSMRGSLDKWGKAECDCGAKNQTIHHVIEECPRRTYPGQTRHLDATHSEIITNFNVNVVRMHSVCILYDLCLLR